MDMRMARWAGALWGCAFLLCFCFGLALGAQTIAGNVVGTVTDASGAVIPGAHAHLVKDDTSIVRDVDTDRDGIYRFPNLPPGNYALTISATGFKDVNVKNVVVTAQQELDLGKSAMAVGSQNETVTVTAAVTPIQTSSSEVSASISGNELMAEPLRGRDLFGSIKLDAGVLDTDMTRDVTTPTSMGSITIDGNPASAAVSFTVDGIGDMDTGDDGEENVEPNMDAVQEITVLSSNYQAEYGRNSGGTISVVTKSGTSQYHGTGWWNYRHEDLNANAWINNADKVLRPEYRFNVAGWSFGGPVPIHALKDKLFFFASQEYTNQLGTSTTDYVTMPTPQELGETDVTTNTFGATPAPATEAPGYYPFDFSDAFTSGKTPITIYEPCSYALTYGGGTSCGDGSVAGQGTKFPGNTIPNNDPNLPISPAGLKMLGFFPAPNYQPPSTSTEYGQANYVSTGTAPIMRRNDIIRVDYDINPRLTSYVRWMHDADVTDELYQGVDFNTRPETHPNPGHGTLWSTTFVISPTLINEVDLSEGNDNWEWFYDVNGQSSITPSGGTYEDMGSPPLLIPLKASSGINGYSDMTPNVSFGSEQPNMTGFSTSNLVYVNSNPVYVVQDNLSKVVGTHQLKIGLYVEDNWKLQPEGISYQGAYNFTNDANDPNDTGDGYANAVLGNFDSFSQSTGRAVFNVNYWNVEWYAQDNWRLTKKLTLDYGLRFYHQTPQADVNDTFAEFIPTLYNSADIAALYVPYCSVASSAASPCPALDEYASYTNPTTKVQQLAPLAYIGDYVPGTGTYFDGMRQLGVNGVSDDPYTQSFLKAAPRIGFAYDVFGNGKTALRGGYGVYYNRIDGNAVYGMSGQPPVTYGENVSYANISDISSTATPVVAPPSVTGYPSVIPWPEVRNASLGVEHELGFNTSIDVSYVGNWNDNADLGSVDELNDVALGSDYISTVCPNCGLSSVTGKALTQASDSLLRTNYPGYEAIGEESFVGYDNYNALQTTVSHRLSNGFLLSAAWTWSKSLGVSSYDPLVPNNNERNYGPTSVNRPEELQITYSYLLPNPGKALGSSAMGAVTDGWTLSGLTTFQSGSPWTPGYSNLNNADYTGSTNETARAVQIGDPFVNVPAGELYNPAAFQVPPNGLTTGDITLGNVGVNPYNLPMWENWDMTMTKFIPAGWDKESGFQVQFSAFNVFNHAEFTGWQETFNTANFGVPTGTNPARIMSFNLRYQF